MNDEAKHRDTNTGVSDVKSRPGMHEREMKIEKKKIDYMLVQQAIGQIAEDTREKQTQRYSAPPIRRFTPE